MKLLHVVTLRLSLLAAVVLAFWSVFFYVAMIDEVNDEIDDSLEDYAKVIIIRSLSGEPLPTNSNGSNNQFYLREVSAQYAATVPHARYADRDVYIAEKKEMEPARVLSYIFRRDDGRFMEIEVSTPTIEKEDLREAIFFWILFLYVAIMIGIVAINVWGIRHSMRPLRNVLRWLDAYRLGQPNKPLNNPTHISEFSRLNNTVVGLTERNERLYEQQKIFIGNTSHEMQTPLAICQNRLEMLLEEEGLTEQQMGEVVKTLRTLEQLSRLNRSLLLLCKIDSGQFADTQRINIGDTIKSSLADLEVIYASRHIHTTFTEHSPLVLEMNPLLTTTLVSNLIKNAYIHNVSGGHVEISVTSSSVSIANSGQEEPLDATRIFDHFYHTPDKATSSGLGLPLVRAICRLYGLSIAYRHADQRHLFEITVPHGK